MLNLPPKIQNACASLLEAVPFDTSMAKLTGSGPHHTELVEQVLSNPALSDRPELAAGLWLYVDNLERSHTIAQGVDNPTGSYWHGIMHRREGDFSNSHYWMRRAAGHPLLLGRTSLDPGGLVDAVAAAKGNPLELVARQREEWKALFEWCAANPPLK